MKFQFTDEQKASLSKGFKKMNAGPTEWSGYDFPAWSTMKSVLEARIISSVSVWLIAVPILLNLTSEFPERYFAAPFGGTQQITFVLEVPINWYLLYFSAICFAIAKLLYLVWCPQFIRKYGSSASASSDGVTAELVRDYASDYLTSIGKKKLNRQSPEGQRLNSFLLELTNEGNAVGQHWDGSLKQETLQSFVAGSHVREIPGTGTYLRTPKLTGEEEEDKKRLTSLLLWKFIDWLDHARVASRGLISLLLIFGGFLLLIPFAQGFWLVFSDFLQRT